MIQRLSERCASKELTFVYIMRISSACRNESGFRPTVKEASEVVREVKTQQLASDCRFEGLRQQAKLPFNFYAKSC